MANNNGKAFRQVRQTPFLEISLLCIYIAEVETRYDCPSVEVEAHRFRFAIANNNGKALLSTGTSSATYRYARSFLKAHCFTCIYK